MEKYSKLSFILMLSLVIFVAGFALRKQSQNSADNNANPQISASEVKSSRRSSTGSDTGFLLRLEGNTLFAYHIINNTCKSVEQAEIEISSFSAEDIKLLQNGIYADSAEELFLYFESYTS